MATICAILCADSRRNSSVGLLVLALLQGRQRRERMARPDRPPPAHRTRRLACADRDQFPEAGTRWRSRRDRPRHRASVSGGSSASTGCRSTGSAGSAGSGRNTRSIASSTSLSIGSSVTTQFCTTVAGTRPTTRNPSAPCRVRSKPASSRGSAATPAELGDGGARRLVRREIDLPAGFRERRRPRPERSRPRHAGWLARGWLLRWRQPPPGRETQARRAPAHRASCRTEPPARLAHIGSQPPSAQRRLGDAEHVARDGRLQRRRIVGRRARLRRPWRGRRTPPPPAASPWAPRDRRRPFRGNCRRCPGRTGRTAAGRRPSRRHARWPIRRSSSTRCNTIMSSRAPPCPARRNQDRTRRSRLRHDHAIEGVDVAASAGSGGRGAKS